MAQTPSPQKRPPNTVDTVLAYSKRFLLYGFGLSILLHLTLGPFIEWKRPPEEKEQIEKVLLSKKVTKVTTPRPTPTPTPVPTPTPTPQPKETPPPQTPPPKQVRLKVEPPKQTSQNVSGESTEQQYNVKSGSQSGVPNGTLASGPPATPVAATAAPAPTATKASCANPNADATATQKVTPDMPEIARQMGATGTAQIKVTLDANGNVTAVSVFRSTNNKALDQAAMQAAQQSKYSPEIRDCQKVGGSYLYTVTFESQ